MPGRKTAMLAAMLAAAAHVRGADADADAAADAVKFAFVGEVASGYLSSGGTLGDTWPVSTQMLAWEKPVGEDFYVSGYGWWLSALHNRQHDRHRALFYDFETTTYCGWRWRFADGYALDTKAGPLWNPTIGYEDGHNCNWGIHYVQSLRTPLVTPYANWLWMLQPSMRARLRLGLYRGFALTETLTLTPSVETVWMDSRRYQSRYGGIPQDRFLGGAFATMTTGVSLRWRYSRSLAFFVRARQFDVVNSQSRRAVKRQDSYYAKCDWPVFGVGVECDF